MSPAKPARPALLRSLNDRTVVELLVAHGPQTRADLAAASGLSKPTIAEVLARLEAAGLVVPAGEAVGRRGPNGRLHDVAGAAVHAAAVSVTSGVLAAELVDVHGRVMGSVERRRRDLPRGAADATRALLAAAAEAAGISPRDVNDVVIAVPGSYDAAADQVRFADRIPDWTGRGLAASIAATLGGGTHVLVENDANLALAAERASARWSSTVSSLLWLGDGIGLATDLGGTPFRGENGGAGEIGYIPVPAPASRARTAYAAFQDIAGAAAVHQLARQSGVPGRSAAAAVAGAAAHHRTDAASAALLDEVARRLALGLAVVAAVLDPGLVVLGGEVGRAGGEPLASRTATALRAVGPLRCRVVASTVDGDPALAGARLAATGALLDRFLDAANRTALAGTAVPITPPDAVRMAKHRIKEVR
jgi:predicted NBD/HSP70 family sugar kinase